MLKPLSKQYPQFTNAAGPRRGKQAERLLSEIRKTFNETVELYGPQSNPQRMIVWGSFAADAECNPAAVEAYKAFGESQAWTIPKAADALEAFERAALELLAAARASRPVVDKTESAEQQAARQQAAAQRAAEQAAKDAAERQANAAVLAKAPAGAKAVIVAELDHDESDLMTDYHNHRTVRCVAIGWRMTEKENFAALRKAAAGFAETRHLGPGCDVWRAAIVFAEDVRLQQCYYYKGQPSPWHRELLPPSEMRFTTEAEARAWAASKGEPEPIYMSGGGAESARFEWKISCSSIEHRDNYSMGGGNYLKAGFDDGDGWRVKSYRLTADKDGRLQVSTYKALEDGLPADLEPEPDGSGPQGSRPQGGDPQGGGTGRPSMQLNAEKNGVELRFPDKPTAEQRAALEAAGFRVTRRPPWVWYAKQTAEAITFATELASGEPLPAYTAVGSEPLRPKTEGEKAAAKLRRDADRLQKAIDKPKPYDGMNPTRKRLQAWDQHAKDVRRAEQLQAALRWLADRHDAVATGGETCFLPPEHGATGDTVEQPYLDPNEGQRETQTPVDAATIAHAENRLRLLSDAEQVRAVLAPWGFGRDYIRDFCRWVLLTLPKGAADHPDRDKQRRIDEIERGLLASRPSNSYFPTPPELADRVAQLADLRPGLRVLEPSAGSGRLADAVMRAEPAAKVHCIERTPGRLIELLQLKGYDVLCADFVEWAAGMTDPANQYRGIDTLSGLLFDRIVMNPPFENLQDIEHVRKAYSLLRPGGRLVAIMSPAGWFRQDKAAAEFRAWLSKIMDTPGREGESPDWADRSGPVNWNAWAFSGEVGVLHGRSWAGWEVLPEGSFKESGTGVSARLLVIDKPAAGAAESEVSNDRDRYSKQQQQRPADSSAAGRHPEDVRGCPGVSGLDDVRMAGGLRRQPETEVGIDELTWAQPFASEAVGCLLCGHLSCPVAEGAAAARCADCKVCLQWEADFADSCEELTEEDMLETEPEPKQPAPVPDFGGLELLFGGADAEGEV